LSTKSQQISRKTNPQGRKLPQPQLKPERICIALATALLGMQIVID
jgi:hypothetical protein